MYIIEIIVKLLRNKKIKELPANSPDFEADYEDNYEDCHHVYMAIDSTQDYFACNKCGHVIKNEKKKHEKINIFKV